MNLPNYFLVDLPTEAILTPGLIAEACQTLKRNRESYLQSRSTESLVRTLSGLAADWLEPTFRFRQMALDGAHHSGFTVSTLARGLDLFFGQLTAENISALLVHELGHGRRLDELVSAKSERERNRAALARGPEMLGHFASGNIPSPTLMSMIFGMLLRSAQFVKCASGGAFLPRLFAHSIYEADPKLASCLELAEWRGGSQELEAALFQEADCITATGSDETLDALRSRVQPRQRFIGYGHRVSFGLITRAALGRLEAPKVAAQAAADVTAWNQLGCLSPHVFYLERGGRISADEFAELLATELARLEEIQPRGPVPDHVAAAIATRRMFYEVRAAHSGDTRLWGSPESTAWTVVYEAEPVFQPSCLHRFVYVKPVAEWRDVLAAVDRVRGRVSTVGLAAPEEQAPEIAVALARWGATRICPLGRMQDPPLTWRHDGRPALADLITWTDWELAEEE